MLTGRQIIFHMICVDSNSTGHRGASNLNGKGLSCRERRCWIVAGLARNTKHMQQAKSWWERASPFGGGCPTGQEGVILFVEFQ